jgi:hypothetical protein
LLTCEADQFESVWGGAQVVAAHQFKYGRVQFAGRERADMGQAGDPRLHAINE